MKNLMVFESFAISIDEAQKGLMHKLLEIPQGEKISDRYKSGKKLAADLINALKKSKVVPQDQVRKKASSMLAFAANWPSDGPNSVLDKALRSIKNLSEAEVAIAEDPIAEGPDQKIFIGKNTDRQRAKTLAKDAGRREGYNYQVPGKSKLTGTEDANGAAGPPFTYTVVMSKNPPEENKEQ